MNGFKLCLSFNNLQKIVEDRLSATLCSKTLNRDALKIASPVFAVFWVKVVRLSALHLALIKPRGAMA